jgi:hypothetical protein
VLHLNGFIGLFASEGTGDCVIETGWAVLRAGGCGRPDWQVKNCFFFVSRI